eukprot:10700563-Prorocentrum_lima.AAC.1
MGSGSVSLTGMDGCWSMAGGVATLCVLSIVAGACCMARGDHGVGMWVYVGGVPGASVLL